MQIEHAGSESAHACKVCPFLIAGLRAVLAWTRADIEGFHTNPLELATLEARRDLLVQALRDMGGMRVISNQISNQERLLQMFEEMHEILEELVKQEGVIRWRMFDGLRFELKDLISHLRNTMREHN